MSTDKYHSSSLRAYEEKYLFQYMSACILIWTANAHKIGLSVITELYDIPTETNTSMSLNYHKTPKGHGVGL